MASKKAGELVLKAIDCTKRDEVRQAVEYLDEAIECIEYAMNYENYGSTGQHIMKQKLKQYTKYVAKLRAKLPPEDEVQDEADVQPLVPQTTAEVHMVAKDTLITTAVEDSNHTVTYPQLVTSAVQEPHQTVTYPQLVPTSLDEPDCGQHTAIIDRLHGEPPTGQEYTDTDRLKPQSGQQVTSGDRLQQHTADTLHAARDNTTQPSQEDHHTELVTKIMSPTLRPAHQPPASSTPGDVLFKMPPGEADYKNLGTAITFAKKATQADTENSLAEALDLYNKAIDFFHLSMNGELNTELGQQHVRPQVDYCENRAEVISRVLQSDRSGYLSTDEDGGDRDSTSEVGDRIGDAATLQRQGVENHDEIVGLDVVRSVLLDAATSSSGSFRSILLVGATGTGKTSVVDNLFRNTSRSYIYKDAAIFSQLDTCVDTSLVDVFEGARQVKPCVIFLDRIDELFPRGRQHNNRNSTGQQAQRQLSEQLTEQLTDFEDRNKEMIFISATDCPWFISPEVRDRFDTVIYTPLPGPAERLSIAKLNTANMLHALSEEDFVTIAERTHGFTGADIDSVIRSAMVSTIKELQNATHFKQVKFPEDQDTQAWTPCSPEEPGARQMLWSDVVQVHPPEITMRHVLESLEDRGSSVPASEIYRLRDWVLQTGKAPPEQADLVRNRPEEPVDLPPGPEEAAATLAVNVPHPAYRPSTHTNAAHHNTEQPPVDHPANRPSTLNHRDMDQPQLHKDYGHCRTVETSTLQGSSPINRLTEVGLVSEVTAALVLPPSHGTLTPESSSMFNITTTDMSTQTEVVDESASFTYHQDYPSMGSMGSMGPLSVDAFCQTEYEDEQPHGLLIIPEPPQTVIPPEATVYETSSPVVTAANIISTETIPEPPKAVIPSGAIVYETSSPKMAPKSMSTETRSEPPSALVSCRPTVYQTDSTPMVTATTPCTTTVTPNTTSDAPQSSGPGVFLRTVSEHNVGTSEPQPVPDNMRDTEQEPCMDQVVPDKVRQEQPPADITLYSIYRQPLLIPSGQSHDNTQTPESDSDNKHSDTPPVPGNQHSQPIEKQQVATAEVAKVNQEKESFMKPTDNRTGDIALAAVGVMSEVPHQTEKSPPERCVTKPEELIIEDDGRKSMQTVEESWHEEVIYDNAGKDTAVVTPVVTPELLVKDKEQSVEDKSFQQVEENKSRPDEVPAVTKLEPDKSAPKADTASPVEEGRKVEETLKATSDMEKDKSIVEVTPSQNKQVDKSKPEKEVAEPEVVKKKLKQEHEEEASKPEEVTAVVKIDKTKQVETTPVQKAEESKPKIGAPTEIPTLEQIDLSQGAEPVEFGPSITSTPIKGTSKAELTKAPSPPVVELEDVSEVSTNQDKDDVERVSVQQPAEAEGMGVKGIPTITTTPPTPDTAVSVLRYEREPTIPHRDITENLAEPEPLLRHDIQSEEEPVLSPSIVTDRQREPDPGDQMQEPKQQLPISPVVASKAPTPVSPIVESEADPHCTSHPAVPQDPVPPYDAVQHRDLDQDEPMLEFYDDAYFITPTLTSIKEEEEPEAADTAPVSKIAAPGPADSQPSAESVLTSVEPATPCKPGEVDKPSGTERVAALEQVSLAQKELVAALEKVQESETGLTPEEDGPTSEKVRTPEKVPVIEEFQPSNKVQTLETAPQQDEPEQSEDISVLEKVPVSKEAPASENVPTSENTPDPENALTPEKILSPGKTSESEKAPEADEADMAPKPVPIQKPPSTVPTKLTLAMEEEFMKEQLRKMAETEENELPVTTDVTTEDVKDDLSVLKDSGSLQAQVSKDEVLVSHESTKKKDDQPLSSEDQMKSDIHSTWL